MRKELESLKQTSCVHCLRMGTLNRHDRVYGNDPAAADKQTKRGRRVWCSNRGRRGGCGRTMAVLFVWVLPRHSLTATRLGEVLGHLCAGMSIQAAWARSGHGVPLQSLYHLLQRFRTRLDAVRTALLGRCQPPCSKHRAPLRQTAEHLGLAFPVAACAVAAFQYELQTPIMG